jgi:hypothetical protein
MHFARINFQVDMLERFYARKRFGNIFKPEQNRS